MVCHDLFDNYERMKIVVAPVIARYPGAQVRRKREGAPNGERSVVEKEFILEPYRSGLYACTIFLI